MAQPAGVARKTAREIFDDKWMPEPNSGCWLWLGSTDGNKGYGRVQPCVAHRHRQAHRLGYELYVGPIPDGFVIDHKCRNPSCVNPAHLEPVTPRENQLRGNYRNGLALGGNANGRRQRAKTHCPHGHSYDNAIVSRHGYRRCRPCFYAHERARIARKRAAQSAV